jgi:pilus assembly protein CpaD
MIKEPRRIFLRSRRAHVGRCVSAIFAAAVAATLAGCSETTYWTPAEAPKQPKVDWVRFDHRVMFDPRAAHISLPERARMEEFLARIEPRYGDQVQVGTGTGSAEGEIGIERVAAVAEYLRGSGLKVGPMPASMQGRWDGAVRISVGRYVVTAPNCPDWSKSASYDPLNHVSSNFGCATTTNLGLMVADPGDLVRGRPMGPADGAYSARAIKTWREGDKASSSSSSSMSITFGSQGGQSGAGAGGSQ